MEQHPHDKDRRPTLAVSNSGTETAVKEFASGLQAGHDRRDAELLNHQFASDVVWDSPCGALVEGYEQLHPIHIQFQGQEGERPRARYEVRHMLAISGDGDQPFSELAMYVLVRRGGHWWLAAGQHTPMKPGGALPPKV